MKVRAEALRQILEAAHTRAVRVKKLLTTPDLRAIALHAYTNVYHDHQFRLNKLLDWEDLRGRQGELMQKFAGMNRCQLSMMLLACALASDLQVSTYCGNSEIENPHSMAEFAKRYHIDLDIIRSTMRAAAAKGKKKTKAAKGGAE
jgi:hypothetical protein